MKQSIIRHYFTKRIEDDAQDDKQFLNARVFRTVDRFLREKAGRSLSGALLDVGCGDGAFVKLCNGKGLKAHGVDIMDGIDFESDPLEFPDATFDIVTMFSVIEHLKDPSNILTQVQRILKKDGLVVIITPNLYTTKFRFWDDPTHVKPYSPTNLPWLMNMFHFQKVALGLWTVDKSLLLWRLPESVQFFIGAHLPFTGLTKYVPRFLKGRSTSILAIFRMGESRGTFSG